MDKTITKNSDELNIMPVLTPISIFVSAILIFIGLMFIAFRLPTGTVTSSTTSTVASAATSSVQADPVFTNDQIKDLAKNKGGIIIGDVDKAKVNFIEFSDPSCPYCHVAGGDDPQISKLVGGRFTYNTDGGSYVPPVTEIEKLVKDGKASFTYFYMKGHAGADVAAQAMYCANDQGKFWEAHKLLMSQEGYYLMNPSENNTSGANTSKQSVGVGTINNGSVDQLVAFLKDVVDTTKLTDCLNSKKYSTNTTNSNAFGPTYLVSYQQDPRGTWGTPGFFVNTTRFGGAYSYSDMKIAVDQLLNN